MPVRAWKPRLLSRGDITKVHHDSAMTPSHNVMQVIESPFDSSHRSKSAVGWICSPECGVHDRCTFHA